MNSTYFGLLAELGEANIPLVRISLKYFGLSVGEAARRASSQQLPCRVFRLGGQKSPWLVSIADLAELIDKRRAEAGRLWDVWGKPVDIRRRAALSPATTP